MMWGAAHRRAATRLSPLPSSGVSERDAVCAAYGVRSAAGAFAEPPAAAYRSIALSCCERTTRR